MYSHVVKPEHCAIAGYDPVESKRAEDSGLYDAPLVDACPMKCVEYKQRIFRFKDESNLLEFITYPYKYSEARLTRRPDRRSADEYAKLGDVMGYMSKAVVDPLIDAMTVIIRL